MNRFSACVAAALMGLTALGGCATSRPAPAEAAVTGPVMSVVEARQQPMFDGREGTPLAWSDLADRMAEAEIIIFGELHDDAAGHVVQLAMVQEVLAAPGGAALSLEFLERDQQVIVDDYLDGIIDTESFLRLARADRSNPPGSWQMWYQPMIDAAKEAGARVVAANAPRRYARLAREHGFERIEALPPDRRALAVIPVTEADAASRARFWEVINQPPDMPPATAGRQPAPGHEWPMPDEKVEAMFRAQRLWDATMADAIDRAMKNGAARVVHIVGQFHSDREGGLVQEVRRLRPEARLLVISLVPNDERSLRPEDRGRADLIIHTGAPSGGHHP